MSAPQLVVSNPSVSGPHLRFGIGSVNPTTGYSGYYPDNPDIPGVLDPDWALSQWEMTGPDNQPEYLNPATGTLFPENDCDPYYGSALYSVTNSDGTGNFSVFQAQGGGFVYDIEDSISPATAPVGAAAPLQNLFLSTTPFASNQPPITLNHPLTVSFDERIREAVVSGTDTTGDASDGPVATGLLGIVLTYNSATFHASLFLQTVLTDSRYGSTTIDYQNSSFDGYTTTVIYNDQTNNNVALPYVSSNNVQCVDLSVNAMLNDALAAVPSLTATESGTENLADWTFNGLYMGIETTGADYAPGIGLTGSTTLDLQLSNIEIAQDLTTVCSCNPAPAEGSAVISDTLLGSPNAIVAPIVSLATAPTAANDRAANLGTAAPGTGTDALSVTLTSDADFATGSTLVLNNGTLLYTPGPITGAFVGTDAISYTVTDTLTGAATTESQNVTLTASATGDPSDTGSPTVVSVTASPDEGEVTTGALESLTVTMSAAVIVAGGTPSLSLNDGGTATYDAARSTPASLVFDYTVLSGQSTPALAVTGLNGNGATIQDAEGNNVNLVGALTALDGVAVNDVSANTVSATYTAILCTAPTTTLVNQTVGEIDAGESTLAQFASGLITSDRALYTTLPVLVTIDAYYGATPQSSLLTAVAADTGSPAQVGGFYSAPYLHSLGFSDPNVWTIMASQWGADPNSAFYAMYSSYGSNYSSFIAAVYQREFGFAPSATNLQNLVNDVPGVENLLAGPAGAATPIQVVSGIYGYLLYVGQTTPSLTTQYAASADAFLQAAANGTVTYGPELTQEFPSGTAADPGVMTITSSDQLIDPGAGSYTMQFLAGTSGDTLMLHADGVDQVSGFNPGTDVLDFSSVLSEAGINLNGGLAALGNYVTIVDQGTNALVNFNPTGHGGGSTVAVLQGQGSTVTSLGALVADNAIRIA